MANPETTYDARHLELTVWDIIRERWYIGKAQCLPADVLPTLSVRERCIVRDGVARERRQEQDDAACEAAFSAFV